MHCKGEPRLQAAQIMCSPATDEYKSCLLIKQASNCGEAFVLLSGPRPFSTESHIQDDLYESQLE